MKCDLDGVRTFPYTMCDSTIFWPCMMKDIVLTEIIIINWIYIKDLIDQS